MTHWNELGEQHFPSRVTTEGGGFSNSFLNHSQNNSDDDDLTLSWILENQTQARSVDLVEGYAGIAYRLEDFKGLVELLEEISQMNPACRFSDDLVLSYSLALNGIPRMRIQAEKPIEMPHTQKNALSSGNGFQANEKKNLQKNSCSKDSVDPAKYCACLSLINLLALDGNLEKLEIQDIRSNIQTVRKQLDAKWEQSKGNWKNFLGAAEEVIRNEIRKN